MAKKYIVEKEFNHNGLKCVVIFSNMGHRCGYVGVPKWHPLYGKDYMDYLDIKKEHQDSILFFRLGDFYEMFFDDAETASRELELTLTGKQCG